MFVGLVGGHDGRAVLVALAEHLEEEVSPRLIDGQVSEFINLENVRAQILLEFTGTLKWTPEFGPEVKLDFAVDRWV